MIDPALPKIAREKNMTDFQLDLREKLNMFMSKSPARDQLELHICEQVDTLLRQQQEAMQPYVQHKFDCPQRWDKKWITIRHNEQHIDDEAMETCHFAPCRAWSASDNPSCTCGLDQLFPPPPSGGDGHA